MSVKAQAVSDYERLLAKITARTARIGVIGLGYVGLPLSLLFSDQGFTVTGFDIDSKKVEALNNRKSYIHRIAEKEIEQAGERGFSATCDFATLRDMDAIVMCVPTPLDEHHQPDLSYIVSTAESIAPYMSSGKLVILESTTYPGTTEEVVVPVLERGNGTPLTASRPGKRGDFYVAYSPEREDPGNQTVERRNVPKVVGGMDKYASELGAALYGSIFQRAVTVSTPAAAEMTKLLENIYRCVNIALVNELKLLCLRMGIDIWEVIDAASTKPFGFQPFYPGPGLGGHCIPIDPFYLSWKAKEFDFHTKFIELAGEVNIQMPYHVVSSLSAALNKAGKPVAGSSILVLGVAYKKDVDDLRESPALTIIELLQKQGAHVDYHDPYFPFLGQGRKYNLQLKRASLERISEYDCILIVTDHSEYDYSRIVHDSRLVLDTRNATKGLNSPNLVRC